MRARTVVILVGIVLLLSGCAQPVYNPTPTLSAEDIPPPVSGLPFSESPVGEPTAERPPTLYLNPSAISLEVGQTATVEVWADGVGGVYALSLEMSFDPSLIRVEDADPTSEGIQALPGEMMGRVLENRVEEGRLFYQAAAEPEGTTSAGGRVLSLTVYGVAPGTTLLRLENIAAQDAAGGAVAVSPLSEGLITVGGGAVEPTLTEEVPPLVMEPSPAPTVAPTPWVAPYTPMPAVTGGIYYVVGPGENLFRIGLKFGTTAQAIATANNIPDPRQVRAGTMVLVPVPPSGGGYGYYVRPGDTVYSIARRFGMTVEELAALNGIGPDFAIRAGTILKVTPRQ